MTSFQVISDAENNSPESIDLTLHADFAWMIPELQRERSADAISATSTVSTTSARSATSEHNFWEMKSAKACLEWLARIGYPQYVPMLQRQWTEEGMDKQCLFLLDVLDLVCHSMSDCLLNFRYPTGQRRYGITNHRDRRGILSAIRELREFDS